MIQYALNDFFENMLCFQTVYTTTHKSRSCVLFAFRTIFNTMLSGCVFRRKKAKDYLEINSEVFV